MMSICSWLSDFFSSNPVPVTPAAPEEKPPETFCRSNRYNDWLLALNKDINGTQADRLEIKCYNNDSLYRGTCSPSKGPNLIDGMEKNITLWNCDTLIPVSLSDIYEQGVEWGRYYGTDTIHYGDHESYRHRAAIPEVDPTQYEVMPRFENRVNYLARARRVSAMYHSYSTHYEAPAPIFPALSETLQHWKVAEEWNKDKLIALGELADGTVILTEYASYMKLDYVSLSRQIPVMLYNRNPDEEPVRHNSMLSWVLEPLMRKAGGFRLFGIEEKDYVDLFDPIRIIRLEDDQDVGTEAYVALVEGKLKDTFTRQRFRIEVDSETLYTGMIVNLGKLYKAASDRLKLERCEMHGRLYVDNIRYMLKDGSEHSSSPSGFSAIGAEPFLPKWERVYRNEGHQGNVSYSGPYIITNELYPEAPIY
jgi:hypothetical protein